MLHIIVSFCSLWLSGLSWHDVARKDSLVLSEITRLTESQLDSPAEGEISVLILYSLKGKKQQSPDSAFLIISAQKTDFF